MGNKPLREMLEDLHKLTVEELQTILRDGVVKVVNTDEGEVAIRVPVPPAYFTAAITLLKNNGIEVNPDDENNALNKLKNTALPFDPPARDALN